MSTKFPFSRLVGSNAAGHGHSDKNHDAVRDSRASAAAAALAQHAALATSR